jgi:hypothetical protein
MFSTQGKKNYDTAILSVSQSIPGLFYKFYLTCNPNVVSKESQLPI